MKYIVSFSFLLCGYSFLYSQNNFEAVSYYQMIKNEQTKIGREIYFYKNSVSDLNLKLLRYQIKESIAVVDSLPAYNNETRFKNSIVELLKYFLNVSENQYKQLLQLVEDPELDNKEYKAKLKFLFSDISSREKPYDERFNAEEDAYTQKYGIKIE